MTYVSRGAPRGPKCLALNDLQLRFLNKKKLYNKKNYIIIKV
jgi:hypothetical protein